MIGIYKITNPNNEIYIGQSKDIDRRIYSHKINSSNKKLKKSFEDFGFENHKIEVICECCFSELYDKEKYFIEFYGDTFTLLNSHYNKNVDSHRKKPKEQHKLRIVVFVPPEVLEVLTMKECQDIAKSAIKKEFKKRLKK